MAGVRAGVSGKTPYLRFDGNDYSIPHTLIRRPLTVVAPPTVGASQRLTVQARPSAG